MAVDKKISQLASGAPAQAGDEYVVARSGANFKLTLTNIAASMPPIGATTPNTGSFTSLTNSGNLNFSSTGQRITGDFSNATLANQVILQTNTTNGNTTFYSIPNGTGTLTSIAATNNSDVSGTSTGAVAFLQANSTDGRFGVGRVSSSGTFLPMTFYTGGGERMRLDTSGNLGIGTASPGAKLQVQSGTLTNPTWASSDVVIAGNSTGNATYYQSLSDTAGGLIFSTPTTRAKSFVLWNENNGNMSLQNGSSGSIIFTNNGSERMRIDSSGNVGIGTASPGYRLDVQTTTTTSISRFKNDYGTILVETPSGGPNRITSLNSAASASQAFAFNGAGGAEFMRITSGGEVYIAGTTDQGAYNLQCNGTGVWGAGAYVNGSDARLKDNIQSLDSGLDVIKAMRPVTFQYKPEYSKDQSVQPGFIAQELQEAMAGKPYLEGVVQEGPNHLNVAYQNIIPILVKAIQELSAKVAALEAK